MLMPKLSYKPDLSPAVFVILAVALSLGANAQSLPSSPVKLSGDQAQSQTDDTTTTLKVNVEVVQLFFNVKDKHGALIPNLNKDNLTSSKMASSRPSSISRPNPICR
jgi:hypothetical protein